MTNALEILRLASIELSLWHGAHTVVGEVVLSTDRGVDLPQVIGMRARQSRGRRRGLELLLVHVVPAHRTTDRREAHLFHFARCLINAFGLDDVVRASDLDRFLERECSGVGLATRLFDDRREHLYFLLTQRRLAGVGAALARTRTRDELVQLTVDGLGRAPDFLRETLDDATLIAVTRAQPLRRCGLHAWIHSHDAQSPIAARRRSGIAVIPDTSKSEIRSPMSAMRPET